jgi:tryptophanyl-tRNA synthetase
VHRHHVPRPVFHRFFHRRRNFIGFAVAPADFARAVTDSGNEIKFGKENKPGISNLLNIMSACTQTPIKELEKKYQGVAYGQFKADVAEAVIELLTPFQERYVKISDNEVKKVLEEGAKRVAPMAQETLSRVKKTIGLGL